MYFDGIVGLVWVCFGCCVVVYCDDDVYFWCVVVDEFVLVFVVIVVDVDIGVCQGFQCEWIQVVVWCVVCVVGVYFFVEFCGLVIEYVF